MHRLFSLRSHKKRKRAWTTTQPTLVNALSYTIGALQERDEVIHSQSVALTEANSQIRELQEALEKEREIATSFKHMPVPRRASEPCQLEPVLERDLQLEFPQLVCAFEPPVDVFRPHVVADPPATPQVNIKHKPAPHREVLFEPLPEVCPILEDEDEDELDDEIDRVVAVCEVSTDLEPLLRAQDMSSSMYSCSVDSSSSCTADSSCTAATESTEFVA